MFIALILGAKVHDDNGEKLKNDISDKKRRGFFAECRLC